MIQKMLLLFKFRTNDDSAMFLLDEEIESATVNVTTNDNGADKKEDDTLKNGQETVKDIEEPPSGKDNRRTSGLEDFLRKLLRKPNDDDQKVNNVNS